MYTFPRKYVCTYLPSYHRTNSTVLARFMFKYIICENIKIKRLTCKITPRYWMIIHEKVIRD